MFALLFLFVSERCGTINIVTESSKQVAAVMSQLKMVIRANYSNPPAHGARVVGIILSDAALFEEWKQELKGMSGRIIEMRSVLYNALTKLNTPGDWNHIKTQIGMFSCQEDRHNIHAVLTVYFHFSRSCFFLLPMCHASDVFSLSLSLSILFSQSLV